MLQRRSGTVSTTAARVSELNTQLLSCFVRVSASETERMLFLEESDSFVGEVRIGGARIEDEACRMCTFSAR